MRSVLNLILLHPVLVVLRVENIWASLKTIHMTRRPVVMLALDVKSAGIQEREGVLIQCHTMNGRLNRIVLANRGGIVSRKKPPQTEVLDKVEPPKELVEAIKAVEDGQVKQRLHHLFKQGALGKIKDSLDILEQYEFCYLMLGYTKGDLPRLKAMLQALDGVSKHYERFVNKEEPTIMREVVDDFATKHKTMMEMLEKENPKLYNKVMAEIEKNAAKK